MEENFIQISRYNPNWEKTWNDFVESSKNGTFLFNRAYMDYHSDRFEDISLLVFRKGKLYCLLPANIAGDTVFSHQGLTYGGFIMNEKCTAEGILEVFVKTIAFFKEMGIKRFIYKPVPHHYHSIPAEEDLYALFRNNASLKGRNIASVILQSHPLTWATLRKRMLKKASENHLEVAVSTDFKTFWGILEDNLKEKYNAVPVHSLKEIESLSAHFPQIKLYAGFKDDKMLGGVVCFATPKVLRIQYISASHEGKNLGVIDAIFHQMLQDFRDTPYFDFGTSNEEGGKILNESLIYQKEGFGGRGICYDTYEIILS